LEKIFENMEVVARMNQNFTEESRKKMSEARCNESTLVAEMEKIEK